VANDSPAFGNEPAVTGKRFATGHDPFAGLTAKALKVKKADMWPLKDILDYFMAWSGEAEDSAKANLMASIPVMTLCWYRSPPKSPAAIF
jgi:hypothetical protein